LHKASGAWRLRLANLGKLKMLGKAWKSLESLGKAWKGLEGLEDASLDIEH